MNDFLADMVPPSMALHVIAWRERSPTLTSRWVRIEGRMFPDEARALYDDGLVEMATGRATKADSGMVVELLYAIPRKKQELRPRYFFARAA